MKTITVFLALCLASTYASVQPSYEGYLAELQDIIALAKRLQIELLEQNYETTVSTKEVDDLLQAIEMLGANKPECKAAAEKDLTSIMDDLFDTMEMCDATTYASAGEITKDVFIVLFKILLDATDLAAQFKTCQSYQNTGWKATCYTKFAIKIGLAINDLRVTITDMVNNGKGRIAAVYADGQTCNQLSVDRAVQQLLYVRSTIAFCASEV